MLILAVLLFIGSLHKSDSEACSERQQSERDGADMTAPGYFEVKCLVSDDKEYEPKQCWGSTGRCWCVDKYGETIPGSHVNPGQEINCETTGWCTGLVKKLYAMLGEEPMLGSPSPSCDESGNFAKSQSWGSTGQSWCAISDGREIPGTKTMPGVQAFDCEELPPCLAKVATLVHYTVGGMYLPGLNQPECDDRGYYEKLQCHSSTGICGCVNPETGVQIEGTEVVRGEASPDCYKNEVIPGESPDTPCLRLRNNQTAHLESSQTPIVGFFLVTCEEDGSFSPSQCHASTGHCWCVDKDGMDVPGSLTPKGVPRPRKLCGLSAPTCAKKKDQADQKIKTFMFFGMFSPECREDGSYMNRQCWGSTGECWCVDKDGREIPYTRRGPAKDAQGLKCSDMDGPPIIRQGIFNDDGSVADDAGEDYANDGDSAVSQGGAASTATTLIIVTVILACLLIVVTVSALVYVKRASSAGPRYSNVNDNVNI